MSLPASLAPLPHSSIAPAALEAPSHLPTSLRRNYEEAVEHKTHLEERRRQEAKQAAAASRWLQQALDPGTTLRLGHYTLEWASLPLPAALTATEVPLPAAERLLQAPLREVAAASVLILATTAPSPERLALQRHTAHHLHEPHKRKRYHLAYAFVQEPSCGTVKELVCFPESASAAPSSSSGSGSSSASSSASPTERRRGRASALPPVDRSDMSALLQWWVAQRSRQLGKHRVLQYRVLRFLGANERIHSTDSLDDNLQRGWRLSGRPEGAAPSAPPYDAEHPVTSRGLDKSGAVGTYILELPLEPSLPESFQNAAKAAALRLLRRSDAG